MESVLLAVSLALTDSLPLVHSHGERLRVPAWWWPLALGLGALLAAEIHLGAAGWRSWLPYAVVLPLIAGALWWLGRVRVRVDAGELWVDDAHLPLAYVGGVEPVSGEAKRVALGPELAPLAFVVHRPWVPAAVQVTLIDPADPTPYWVISTRRPDELAAAILAGR